MISAACSVIELGLRRSTRLLPSRRMLRLAGYFTCISVIPLLLGAHGLYAATREDAFSIGHELLELSDITRDAETVELNGMRFHHAVALSPAPLPQVLDRIVSYCEQHPGPEMRALTEAAHRDSKA